MPASVLSADLESRSVLVFYIDKTLYFSVRETVLKNGSIY